MGSIEEYQQHSIDPITIEKLASSLSGSKVLTPSSSGYDDRVKRWSELSERQAGAIVLATSAADVSSAVLFAKAQSLDIAVCGGGHSFNGASSSDGGLVIDLSRMRRVSVDPLAKTIKAQGGCLWVDVDKAAGEHELVTVGGTVNHTGIGGLTLGGGYGWLSGKYGLVIDNLLAVQMVLADGSIVTASGDENIDLFWAVRGAGQSFGVATEFTYKAHEQKTPVWAGQLAFLPTHLEELAEVANQLSKSSDGSSAMMYGFTTPPPLFKPVVLAVVFFDGPESAAKDHFAPLLALNPVRNLTSTMPYTAVNSLLNEWSVHGGRKSGKGSSFATPLRPSFFKSMFDEYTALQTRIPDARALILFEFFASEKICSVPQSATAFASRGHYQNVIVSPRWTDPKDDDACRAWAREMAAKFDDEAARAKRDGERTMDLGGVGQYGNYDGLNDKPSAIFGSNYTQLRKLKMIYDPGNMFCKAHLKI